MKKASLILVATLSCLGSSVFACEQGNCVAQPSCEGNNCYVSTLVRSEGNNSLYEHGKEILTTYPGG